MSYWVRFGCDTLGDPSLMRAARRGAKDLELVPWLLAFAMRADDDGRLTIDGSPAEAEDIAQGIPGVDPVRVANCLQELDRIGFLARAEGGAFEIVDWDSRWAMKPSDTPKAAAERKRRQRQREREEREREQERTGHTVSRGTGVTGHAIEREVRAKRKSKSTERKAKSTARSTDRSSSTPLELPDNAARLLEMIHPPRRAQVQGEMVKALGAGVQYRKGTIRATSTRLDSKCAATIARMKEHDVRDPWAYTLQKLADVSDDSPTEAAARVERDNSRSEAALLAEATMWLEQQPELKARLAADSAKDPEIARAVLYNAKVMNAFRSSRAELSPP